MRAGLRRAPAREGGSGGRLGGVVGVVATGLAEVFAIAREMLAIPASMALGLAERLGLGILAVLRFLWPIALAALALARGWLEVAERELTPARALAAVGLAAAALLCASQFFDYREVRAGVPAYSDVEQVAPPPQVEGSARNAGAPHGYALLAVGLAAGALVVGSMLGRWRLARLLFPLGIAAVAVAILVDVPAGLDEGGAAVEFQGAEARLLGAFWVQLSAAAVIALVGPLLASALRPGTAGRSRAPSASRSGGSAGAVSGIQGARP